MHIPPTLEVVLGKHGRDGGLADASKARQDDRRGLEQGGLEVNDVLFPSDSAKHITTWSSPP